MASLENSEIMTNFQAQSSKFYCSFRVTSVGFSPWFDRDF